MNLTWKRQPQQYGAPVDALSAGRVIIATVEMAMGSRGDPTRYRVKMRLPGFKRDAFDGLHDSIDDAKARAERSAKIWFGWTVADPT